jgi:hypothetical protein
MAHNLAGWVTFHFFVSPDREVGVCRSGNLAEQTRRNSDRRTNLPFCLVASYLFRPSLSGVRLAAAAKEMSYLPPVFQLSEPKWHLPDELVTVEVM